MVGTVGLGKGGPEGGLEGGRERGREGGRKGGGELAQQQPDGFFAPPVPPVSPFFGTTLSTPTLMP